MAIMIALGTKEIDPLFIGGKKIKKVYFGTNLVYPSFPKFTTIERDGSSGTYNTTSYIKKGRYRVILVGSGGSQGLTSQSGRYGKSDYFWSWTPGGGACVYCIISIPCNGYLYYKVGGTDTQSEFRVYCTKNYDLIIIARQGNKPPDRAEIGTGGVIETYGTIGLIEHSAIWSKGNNGSHTGERIYCASAISGASSVCKGGGFGEYPYINLAWGQGASMGECGSGYEYHGKNSKPGYFKIERIG